MVTRVGIVLDFCKAICANFIQLALQKSSVTAENSPPDCFLYAAFDSPYKTCKTKATPKGVVLLW